MAAKITQEANTNKQVEIHRLLKDCEYIVYFLTHFTSGPNHIILFERAPYGDLKSYIETQKILPDNDIRDIFRQFLLGLENIHRRGISHGRLGPDDLLIFEKNPWIIKICGFSNAIVVKNIVGVSQGNPFFSDLLSAIHLLYHIGTGGDPFPVNLASEIGEKDNSFPAPKKISRWIPKFLRLMIKDYTDKKESNLIILGRWLDSSHLSSNKFPLSPRKGSWMTPLLNSPPPPSPQLLLQPEPQPQNTQSQAQTSVQLNKNSSQNYDKMKALRTQSAPSN